MKAIAHFRIYQFEIRYQLSQPLFWVAGVLFLLIGVGFSRITLGGEGVWVNAPYSIAFNVALLSLLSIFMVTILTARTALRDYETGMADIIQSTSFHRWKQKLHVIGGLVSAAVLLLLLSILGMMIGSVLVATPAGPFHLSHYLVPFALFIIPNTALIVVFQFLLAQKSGNALTVYLSGIGIYIGYFVISIFGQSPLIAGSSPPDPQALYWAGVLDPFGLTAFLEQTQHWTADLMNRQAIRLKGSLLYNRIAWTGAALLLGYFGSVSRTRNAFSEKSEKPVKPILHKLSDTSYTWTSQDPAGWRYILSVVTGQARIQLSVLLKSKSFIVAAVLWVALVLTELADSIGDGPFDTPFYALAELIVPSLYSPFQAIGSLVIIFFAGELTWMTRRNNIYQLIDGSPASNATGFGAAVSSTVFLVCLLIILMLLSAIGYQLIHGGIPDWTLFLSLFLYPGVPWILTGILTIGMVTFSPGPYLGMFLSAVMVILWPPILLNVLDIQSFLFQFPNAPEPGYSIFSGFSPFLESYIWYMLYWTLFIAGIGIITVAGWKRGSSEGMKHRLGQCRANIDKAKLGFISACTILFFAVGGFIFVSETDKGFDIGGNWQEQWKAAYENEFSQRLEDPPPAIRSVDLKVDLFPGSRSYHVAGRYGVVNQSGVPVDSLLIGWSKTVTHRQVKVNAAGPRKEYSRFNHFLFVFDAPLQPGDTALVTFRMQVTQDFVTDYDPNHSVIENGTFIRLERFIPWLGYDPSLQLLDPGKRESYGLPRIPQDSVSISRFRAGNVRVYYNMTVSTSGDQQIAAPGELKRKWRMNGRNNAHFTTSGEMRMRIAVASAEYKREILGVGNIALHMYYHPSHTMNMPLLKEAARSSLRLLQDRYGKYLRNTLTITEIPSYRSGGIAATSYPGAIFIREHGGFTGDFRSLGEGEVNYLYRRAAHELAHQWWGDKMNPDRRARGSVFLTEAIAEYSAAVIMRSVFGEETYQTLMRYYAEQYLRYRNRIGRETSLLNVGSDNDYIAYFKGPIVMDAVAERMGEKRLAELLREFIDRAADGATAREFYRRLIAETPPEYHPLFKQWFREIDNEGLHIEEP